MSEFIDECGPTAALEPFLEGDTMAKPKAKGINQAKVDQLVALHTARRIAQENGAQAAADVLELRIADLLEELEEEAQDEAVPE